MNSVIKIFLWAASIIFIFCLFLGWYSGVNFLERSFNNAWYIGFSLAVSIFLGLMATAFLKGKW